MQSPRVPETLRPCLWPPLHVWHRSCFFRKAGGACRDFPSEEVSLVLQPGKSFSFRPHFGDWVVVCVQSLILPCANEPFLWPVNSAGLLTLWLFLCFSAFICHPLPSPPHTLQSPFQMHDPFLHLLTRTRGSRTRRAA